MRAAFFAAAFALAMAGGATSAEAQLNLSKCKKQAIVGGLAGAVLGGAVAGHGAKTEGAILGAGLGAGATFGVCKYMDKRSYSRVESGYQSAAQRDRPYSSKWQAEDGSSRRLELARPEPMGGNCRRINGTLTAGGGAQALPAETYCKGSDGVWRPQGG